MLTINDFDDKVIIKYYRDKYRNPKGVVVAISNGILGWSLCSKLDTFNKKKGLGIALSRALRAEQLNRNERELVFYSKVPFSLSDTFERVNEISSNYWL